MRTAQRGTGPAKPVDPERKRIGETLTRFRERYGYSQGKFARELGISSPYLCLIESGRKPLTDRLLFEAARVLELTPLAIKRPDYEMEDAA